MADDGFTTFDDKSIEPKDDTPKRRGRPPGSKNSTTGKTRGRRANVGPIKDGITSMLGGVGLLLSAFPATEQDAIIIASRSEPLVDALGDLAAQDKRVRDVLSKMMVGSAWGSVAFAAAGIALPILANHNLLPGMLGNLFATDENGVTMGEHMASQMEAMNTFDTVEEAQAAATTFEGPTVATA